MHGGQKWFRCANADRQIDQGCRKILRTHPVLGCWCFRTVPASPTTRRGVATIWIETAANGPLGAIGSKRLTPGTPRSYFRPPPTVLKDGAPGESLARESGDPSLC